MSKEKNEAYFVAQTTMASAIRDYWLAGLVLGFDDSSLAQTICNVTIEATDGKIRLYIIPVGDRDNYDVVDKRKFNRVSGKRRRTA